jgi:hypothetical protein
LAPRAPAGSTSGAARDNDPFKKDLRSEFM